jgi:hypothetical protein
MTIGLPEVSTASFARRAAPPRKERVNALVVPPNEIEQNKEEVRETLKDLSIPVADAPLDRGLSSWSAANARGNPTQAVIVATTSEDESVWRAVDLDRSRLENGPTMLFVLSEGAAKTLQRAAPHLMSLIGMMYTTRPRVDLRLVKAIEASRAGRYPELYEAADTREARELDEAVSDVITALGDPRADDRAWRRLGFVGRAVLVEVVPTIAAHWPPGLAAASAVRAALDAWLSSASAPVVVKSLPKAPLAPQALGEAMGVVANAARLMDRAQAQIALSEILDLIFQGYALFPGSEDRRALFDWWLEHVVPASAALRAPPPFGRRVKSDSPPR